MKDTTHLIFKKKFLVSVPSLALQDEEKINVEGILTMENVDTTEYYKNDFTTIYLTINDMVEIRKKGFPIKAKNKEIAKEIFECIEEHLMNWKNYLETSIHVKQPPIEDFFDLDELANEIFNRYTGLFVNNIISKRFSSPIEDFKSIREKKQEIDLNEVKRKSFNDDFIKYFDIEDLK